MTAQLYLFNNFSAMLGKKKVHLGNTTATMAGDVKRHKKKGLGIVRVIVPFLFCAAISASSYIISQNQLAQLSSVQ